MSHWKTRIQLLRRFLAYYHKANTIYDVHSPFVYKFAQQVIEDKRMFYPFKIIENLRQKLLHDDKRVNIIEFGKGSQVDASLERSIKSIVRYGAIGPETGRQLFRLVNWHKPKTILELGTSTGISTMYLTAAALNAKVITIEGNPEIADLAQRNFKQMGLNQIQVIKAPFDAGLDQVFKQKPKLDFVFIDGNHDYSATMAYFEKCLPYMHNESVFVIADIYWSSEMMKAWNNLHRSENITLSIDLYHFGVLYKHSIFREREHFVLVPAKWKPWHLGIFSPNKS